MPNRSDCLANFLITYYIAPAHSTRPKGSCTGQLSLSMTTRRVSLPKDSNRVDVPSPLTPHEIPRSPFLLSIICPGSLIPWVLNYKLHCLTANPNVALRPENPETKNRSTEVVLFQECTLPAERAPVVQGTGWARNILFMQIYRFSAALLQTLPRHSHGALHSRFLIIHSPRLSPFSPAS